MNSAPRRVSAWWHRFLSVRWLIPLLLLVCALSFGLYTLKSDIAQGDKQVEQQAVAEMTLQMTHLQGTLEYLLQSEQLGAVHEEVAGLGSNPSLSQGLLLDARQHVVASIRLAQLGQGIQDAWPELTEPHHLAPMRRARASMTGSVQVSEDRQQVLGYYPIVLRADRQGDEVGMLVLQQELTANKDARRVEAEAWAARSCGVMSVLAALMGLVAHIVLGRRVQRLVSTAHQLAQGALHARAGLGGVDEVGRLGLAFDNMAEQMDLSRRQLQDSQECIRSLLDSTAEAIFGLDLDGRCIFSNRAALRLTGHTRPEALLGRPLHDIIHSTCPAAIPCRVCAAFRQEAALHGDDELIQHPEGMEIPVEYWSHPTLCSGVRTGSVVTFVDISERKRAEEERRRSAESFQTLIERSPEAIFIHRSGALLLANPAAVGLLGHVNDEDLRGQPVTSLVHGGDATPLTEPSVQRAPAEVQFRHRDGRRGWARSSPCRSSSTASRPWWPSPATSPSAARCRRSCARPPSAWRPWARSPRAWRMRSTTPCPICSATCASWTTSCAAMVESGEGLAGERGREMREALKEALAGSQRVRDIVRDLKMFSRVDEEKRGPVDVRAVLDSCVNMAWSEIRHRARLEKDYGVVPTVEGNESRLGQIFLNLLVNAAQAIDPGDHKTNEIRLSTRYEEGLVVVEVRDTGSGIAPENLERLFDPFFTTKPAGVGTGLGLSICQGLVTAMGGRIAVQSYAGAGQLLPGVPARHRAPAGHLQPRPRRARHVLAPPHLPRRAKASAAAGMGGHTPGGVRMEPQRGGVSLRPASRVRLAPVCVTTGDSSSFTGAIHRLQDLAVRPRRQGPPLAATPGYPGSHGRVCLLY